MTLSHAQRRMRRREMATLVGEGMTIPEIVKQFGVGAATVRAACHEHAVVVVGRKGPLPKSGTWAVLAALLNTSAPVDIIAKKHGMGRQQVQGIFERAAAAGVLFPKRKPAW